MDMQEYWVEIEELAKTVTEEAREYNRDIGDVLHETIDGHEWVIYTRHNLEVLQHTDMNTEHMELWRDAKTLDQAHTIAAYEAMYHDVAQHEAFDSTIECPSCGTGVESSDEIFRCEKCGDEFCEFCEGLESSRCCECDEPEEEDE